MKIEEQVLSREQMAHLKELGVDTSDASMAWFMSPKTNQWKIKVKNNFSHELLLRLSPERYVPAYTIGDLIEKLPRYLKPGSKDFERSIRIGADFTSVEYQSVWGEKSPIDILEDIDEMPTLQVLYKLLCWVAKKHKELIK